MMRPNKDAVLSALEEFDQIGRSAFMEKYGFADRNITYEVEHDGRSYPSKAIFGSAFGFMPGDVARNSETCNGTDAREHLEHLGFDILSKDPAGSHKRQLTLFSTNGQAFQPTRTFNRATKKSAYRLQRPGTTNKTSDAEEVDEIIDVARAMLIDGRLARVKATDGTGPANYVGYGKRTLVRYELDPAIAAELGIPAQSGILETVDLDRSVLERLRQLFEAKYPDFKAFDDSGGYLAAEDQSKRALLDRASDIMREKHAESDEVLGAMLLDLVAGKSGVPSSLLDWRIAKLVTDIRREEPGKIEQAAGRLARGDDPIDAISAFASDTWHMLSTRASARPFAESRTIPTMIRGLVDGQRVLGIRSTPTDNASKMLLGKGAFGQQSLTEDEVRHVITLAEEIARIMREEWGWNPRDLWDVQGFIWETCQKRISENADEPADTAIRDQTIMPTNLILYGPPGTGKTYATAEEAVRLCGETVVPDDREALMASYRSLHQKGRIAFVTFHQNFSYEDFVEGLRPVTAAQDEGASGSVGFSLQPQDGVFKLIAELAASNHGRAAGGDAPVIDRNRKIFKMSLGRSWASEDDVIYQDAIRDGYVVLGWGGEVDWSDPRYDAWDAIKERWRQDFPDASGNDPNMSQMYAFRINMQIGSLIVISDGNRKFRAVGEITGPYQFVPGTNGEYNHRRSVRWLWHSDESLPRELIYDKELSQVSAYQMNSRHVNWDGLEQIVAGGGATATFGAPEPFVLIIDEINRANISKVFGELITLLEPDKRIGQENALTVRLPYSKQEFGVPANLHIIGTMNTADRSIALLDTALRRRFEFRELMPDASLLGTVDGIDLAALLATVNERIEYLFDREHQIGHAYFIRCQTRDEVDEVMRNKVIPLLAEYFYEDWAKVAAVLGDGDDGEGDREGRFIDRRRLKAPKGLGGDEDAAPRYRWSVRDTFSYGGFASA